MRLKEHCSFANTFRKGLSANKQPFYRHLSTRLADFTIVPLFYPLESMLSGLESYLIHGFNPPLNNGDPTLRLSASPDSRPSTTSRKKRTWKHAFHNYNPNTGQHIRSKKHLGHASTARTAASGTVPAQPYPTRSSTTPPFLSTQLQAPLQSTLQLPQQLQAQPPPLLPAVAAQPADSNSNLQTSCSVNNPALHAHSIPFQLQTPSNLPFLSNPVPPVVTNSNLPPTVPCIQLPPSLRSRLTSNPNHYLDLPHNLPTTKGTDPPK